MKYFGYTPLLRVLNKCLFFALSQVWMVQTEQQYICIHQCLLAVMEGKENEIPSREIHSNDGYDGKHSKSLNQCPAFLNSLLT